MPDWNYSEDTGAVIVDTGVPQESANTCQPNAADVERQSYALSAATLEAQQPHDDEAAQLAALTELVVRCNQCETFEAACRTLATALQSHLRCERVAVARVDARQTVRIMGDSAASVIDQDSENVRSAQGVLHEAICHQDISVWPSEESNNRAGLLAHEQFAMQLPVAGLCSVPLFDPKQNRCIAAILVVGDTEAVHSKSARNFLMAARQPLAATFTLLQRAERSRFQGWLSSLARSISTNRLRTLVLSLLLAISCLLIPLPYQVKCACELQPVMRRFVAMPFDGKLEKTFVEPGDVVSQNQLLAKIDAREIEWELSGSTADLHRARKERAGHVVAHESGKAKIAQFEVERLVQKTELLQHRKNNLEIKTPVAGMVVSGDLHESEGVHLEVGQSLFEIAPLDQMLVEISVPEDDIRMVKPGMPVTIWFNSFPFRKWNATILKVHPRSELREQENVFIAEVRLDNDSNKLRPGMRGRAKIETSRQPLGWNLFHKPIATALEWSGW